VTQRKPMSDNRRLRVWEEAKGICHICTCKIWPGEDWEVEHVIPLALRGADDELNMRPAHKDCHAGKTKADNKSWSKAKRIAKKAAGIRPRSTFQCAKGGKYKMKIGGRTELR